ncbi:hypothetical protein B9Z19DRAFT_566680 [Tuber borchii]|uniref:Transmembrane protein n=1 Tax=Tuber borchii TaxID=42251 RepID=A0A2T7A1Z6_TUBBO|nr:hypothetical protein B9Z19DRAFT_566680 [Tuber borchii]
MESFFSPGAGPTPHSIFGLTDSSPGLLSLPSAPSPSSPAFFFFLYSHSFLLLAFSRALMMMSELRRSSVRAAAVSAGVVVGVFVGGGCEGWDVMVASSAAVAIFSAISIFSAAVAASFAAVVSSVVAVSAAAAVSSVAAVSSIATVFPVAATSSAAVVPSIMIVVAVVVVSVLELVEVSGDETEASEGVFERLDWRISSMVSELFKTKSRKDGSRGSLVVGTVWGGCGGVCGVVILIFFASSFAVAVGQGELQEKNVSIGEGRNVEGKR